MGSVLLRVERALEELRAQAEDTLAVAREEHDVKLRGLQDQLQQQCIRAKELETKVAELQESSAGLNRALGAERESIALLEGELQRRQLEPETTDASPQNINAHAPEGVADQHVPMQTEKSPSDTPGGDLAGENSSALDVSSQRSRHFDEIQATRNRANALAHRVEGAETPRRSCVMLKCLAFPPYSLRRLRVT